MFTAISNIFFCPVSHTRLCMWRTTCKVSISKHSSAAQLAISARKIFRFFAEARKFRLWFAIFALPPPPHHHHHCKEFNHVPATSECNSQCLQQYFVHCAEQLTKSPSKSTAVRHSLRSLTAKIFRFFADACKSKPWFAIFALLLLLNIIHHIKFSSQNLKISPKYHKCKVVIN